jgi:hypothetical protein
VPVAIGPDAYSAWRSSALGARIGRLEDDPVLRLAGDVAGNRLLAPAAATERSHCLLRHAAPELSASMPITACWR